MRTFFSSLRQQLHDQPVRMVLGALFLGALLSLGGCGGGSGAPNNPYEPKPPANPPLLLQPTTLTLYPGDPGSVTITGGVGPYRAFSSNPAVVPVPTAVSGNTLVMVANPVDGEVGLTVTITDTLNASMSVAVTVKPAPLFTGLTVLPTNGECKVNICSGDTGRASVTAKGSAGAPLANRQIRFDVIFGPYAIQNTNPAIPLVQSLIMTTDGLGTAAIGLKASPIATSQPAQLKATDVASGQSVIANFVVEDNTTSSSMQVIPDNANITAAFKGQCTAGFVIDYYIYGGNPPYRVSSTFPEAVTLINPVVQASGGYFRAITNGTCVDPLTFTIMDSSGKQTTTKLSNNEGQTEVPVPPAPVVPDLVISPNTQSVTGCLGKTIQFVLSGGTAPYSVSTSTPGAVVSPQPVRSSGGTVQISGLSGLGSTTVVAVDASSPQKTQSATITCQ